MNASKSLERLAEEALALEAEFDEQRKAVRQLARWARKVRGDEPPVRRRRGPRKA